MRINSKREVKKLGEICEIVNGGTPKTNVKEYWNGTNLWITPAEMGKREIPFVEKTVRQLSDSGLKNSSAKLLPPYSVILSSRAPIGHLVINTKPMATNQGCKGLIPSGKLFYLFLYYYLYFSVDYLDKLGTGTTFKELPTWKLKEVEILFPLLSEQKRIVAKLDKFSENIKRLEETARKNIQNAKDLFNSVLNETFKNKSAVANDNRQVYKKAHWEVKKLGEVCDVLDNKRKPVAKKDRVNGRYPYYGSSGILDYVSQYIFNERLVLIGEDGAKWSIGEQTAFIAEGKYWVNNHAHVVRPHKDKLLDTWLVNITDVSGYVNGLTVPKLNQERMKSITIPLLSISEQKKIVARLDKLSAETKKLEIVYQKNRWLGRTKKICA